MKAKPEILAPAGSFEALTAAVRSGADAVYLGGKKFSARMKAGNFNDEELKEAIHYCHARGVKVHITINTLIYDSEIPEALDFIALLCRLGADAVIVQDLGLARLCRDSAPMLERHASTQMSVGTSAGVALLHELGFRRAVLPRELSAEEITAIKKDAPCEIEIFVHGALCMCVSGQCYMSSMFGARSGNRGLCAQPCRLPFAAPGGTGHDLSLKDLSLTGKMQEIMATGVDSLKIEGRMKRPEYVSAAVCAVKDARNGSLSEQTADHLRAVFSRSGFTDGYFTASRGRAMFGTRQKEDVVGATDQILGALAKTYEKEVPLIPVSFYLTVKEGEPLSLSADAMGKRVFVRDETLPEKALNRPLTEEALADRLAKCGGTQFYAETCEIDLDGGLIVSASCINALRRKALEELEKAISNVKLVTFTSKTVTILPHRTSGTPFINLRVTKSDQIPDNLTGVENIYIPLKTEEKTVESLKNSGINPVVEVPRGLFGNEKAVEKLLMRAKEQGISDAYCSTLDGLAIAKNLGFNIHTGFSMNVLNSLSEAVLEEFGVKAITLSPELILSRAAAIGGSAPRGLIAYGRLPLMLTRNCPISNGRSCAECQSRSYLTDRMGKKFPVMCSFGFSEVLNSQPIYMADRLKEIKNIDFITLYFTAETKAQCSAILEAYRRGAALKSGAAYTRGLYYRGAE